jgi:hypothetical protein
MWLITTLSFKFSRNARSTSSDQVTNDIFSNLPNTPIYPILDHCFLFGKTPSHIYDDVA